MEEINLTEQDKKNIEKFVDALKLVNAVNVVKKGLEDDDDDDKQREHKRKSS